MRSKRCDTQLVENWLKVFVAPKVEECWMFGSLLRRASANDVDVLVVLREDSFNDILRESAQWRRAFVRQFSLPLHLHRLTLQEAKEMTEVINVVLGAYSKRIETCRGRQGLCVCCMSLCV
jgi:predicted nucleotidyltransferase